MERDQVLTDLADRGVKIFIAAGNSEPNSLAKEHLAKHPNITIVGASEAPIGTIPNGVPSPQLIQNPLTEVVVPGQPVANPNTRVPPSWAFDSEIDKISGMQPDAVTIQPELTQHGILVTANINPGSVYRAGDLERLGQLWPEEKNILRLMTGENDLDSVFVSAEAFHQHKIGFGYVQALVAFTVDNDGMLEHKTGSYPHPAATSFATPNALILQLKEDVEDGTVKVNLNP